MGCAGSRIQLPYEDYDWKELPAEARKAAETMGYTKKIWDNDGKIPLDEMDWDHLTEEQRKAASILGYSEDKWDAED